MSALNRSLMIAGLATACSVGGKHDSEGMSDSGFTHEDDGGSGEGIEGGVDTGETDGGEDTGTGDGGDTGDVVEYELTASQGAARSCLDGYSMNYLDAEDSPDANSFMFDNPDDSCADRDPISGAESNADGYALTGLTFGPLASTDWTIMTFSVSKDADDDLVYSFVGDGHISSVENGLTSDDMGFLLYEGEEGASVTMQVPDAGTPTVVTMMDEDCSSFVRTVELNDCVGWSSESDPSAWIYGDGDLRNINSGASRPFSGSDEDPTRYWGWDWNNNGVIDVKELSE